MKLLIILLLVLIVPALCGYLYLLVQFIGTGGTHGEQ